MDSSIYGALVGISQPWNMRYPLIDFHGNNGSRDGDGPAAMRYTECRLSKIAEATLADIKKNSVDWVPNFDETAQEPVYLPGLFPNLICNGTTGIAVAMACNFAPHNLCEVAQAIHDYVDGKEPMLPGPDFPTGGIIANKKDLLNIYETGSGKIKIRGKIEVEQVKGNKARLVITEIPYTMIGANIGKFLNDIYSLVESKKTNDIIDITNQSSKDGIRIV